MKIHLIVCLVTILISHVHANWFKGNLCWSMPCLNGGSCFGSSSVFLCLCPIDYSGALCEKRLGICQENPCGNRGSCIEKSLTTYECRCYFDYIGPNCEERITKTNHSIWSSLLPEHTKVLFDILHDAYRSKAKDKSYIVSKNGQFDLLDLLSATNSITTTVATMDVEMESMTTDSFENITEQLNFTDTSSIQWFNETEVTTELTNVTSFENNQTTDSSVNTTSTSAIVRKQLLKKLCQKIFSHILTNTSSSSVKTSNSTNVLVSWLKKYFHSQTTTTTGTTTISPLILKPSTQSLTPLKRININDDLHQFDNEH